MTTPRSLTLIAALIIGLSAGVANARPDHRYDGPPHDRYETRDHYRHDRHYQERQHRSARHDRRDRGPGVGPGRHYHRGDYLGHPYRSRHYVVHDWRGHRLHPPPRGYHWVQLGPDYVLVAIASGIIAQIVIGH